MQRLLLLLFILSLPACKYDVPLGGSAESAVDPRITGQWHQVSADDNKDRRVLVLQYSDTEYLVHFQVDNEGLYFRGYPVWFEDRNYVQLQFIGTSDKVIADKHRKYDVLRYELKEGLLSASLLNIEVIGKDIESTEALREAFRQNTGKENLFKKLGEFEKDVKGTSKN